MNTILENVSHTLMLMPSIGQIDPLRRKKKNVRKGGFNRTSTVLVLERTLTRVPGTCTVHVRLQYRWCTVLYWYRTYEYLHVTHVSGACV